MSTDTDNDDWEEEINDIRVTTEPVSKWLSRVNVRVPSDWCRSVMPSRSFFDVSPSVLIDTKSHDGNIKRFSAGFDKFYFGSLDLMMASQLGGIGDCSTSGVILGMMDFDGTLDKLVLDVRVMANITRLVPRAYYDKSGNRSVEKNFIRPASQEQHKGLLKVVLEHGDVISLADSDYTITVVYEGHPSFWQPALMDVAASRLGKLGRYLARAPLFNESYDSNAEIPTDERSRAMHTLPPDSIPYETLIALGQRSFDTEAYNEAIAIWRVATLKEPSWAWAFSKIGDAYSTLGMMKRARENYAVSFERDPSSEYVKNRLQEIRDL